MRRQIILYQSYGSSESFQDEMTYSLISLMSVCTSIPIYLITTGEFDRRDLPLEIVKIEQSELDNWTGSKSYIHRAKIMAINMALREFCTDVLYVDTDTIFMSDPKYIFERINQNSSVMHCREKSINKFNGIFRFKQNNQAKYILRDDAIMCNAGVIGLSRENVNLLEDVLYITDSLNDLDALNYFNTTEQFAFSDVLSRKTNLTFADREICHYYRWKSLMHRLCVAQMKLRSREEFDRAVTNFSPILPPRINPVTRSYSKLRAYPFRNSGAVDWAYYCYLEALLYRRSNPEFAEAMAEQALFSLYWLKPDPGIEALLKRFSRSRIGSENWLSPEMKARWKEHWIRVEQSVRATSA
jgi:hypothetical protein